MSVDEGVRGRWRIQLLDSVRAKNGSILSRALETLEPDLGEARFVAGNHGYRQRRGDIVVDGTYGVRRGGSCSVDRSWIGCPSSYGLEITGDLRS
jgi:hypothetical protein